MHSIYHFFLFQSHSFSARSVVLSRLLKITEIKMWRDKNNEIYACRCRLYVHVSSATLCRASPTTVIKWNRKKAMQSQFFARCFTACRKINGNRPNLVLIYRLHGRLGELESKRWEIHEEHPRHRQNLFKMLTGSEGAEQNCNLNGTEISIENLSGNADNWINLNPFVCECVSFLHPFPDK